MPPVRVLVADDEPLIRSALEELIARDPELELVGAVADAQQAIDETARLRPDVVLLDVRMPRGGGPRAAAEIDALPDAPSTVAFSAYDDRSAIVSMLEAGACGYLVKGAPNGDIVEILRDASRLAGGRVVERLRPEHQNGGLKVLIADEPGSARAALTSLLEGQPGFQVAGVAGNAAEALRLSCIHRPCAVLVGRCLPGDSVVAIREIRQAVPEARVLAYTPEAEPRGVREALEAGALSYLVTGNGDEEVLDALHDAARGRSTLSVPAATAVVRELSVAPRAVRDHRRHSRRRAQLERFIRGEGVSVAVQPIFELGTGEAIAVEALARFESGSNEGPSLWFAQAAEAGLTAELELATFRAALESFQSLSTDVCLAVNVSPSVVSSPQFGELLTDVSTDRLIVEITEHAAVEDYAGLASAFGALRERGLKVAVDDAGAGFASLRHVLLIDPDYLKLDISLCAGIARDRRRRALARALLAFARETGIRTVAEGVESEEDLAALIDLGVEFAQGFHLAPPAPLHPVGRSA